MLKFFFFWTATNQWFLVMLPKDNLSIDSFDSGIALMVIRVMVIRWVCIFYRPLSAGASIAFFVINFFLFYDIELYFKLKYCKNYLNLGFVLVFL